MPYLSESKMNRAELVREVKTLEKLLKSYRTILEIHDNKGKPAPSDAPPAEMKKKQRRSKRAATTPAMVKILKDHKVWLTSAQLARRLDPGANSERNKRLKRCVRRWLSANKEILERKYVDKQIMYRGV
jgi:hypothetical protein